MPGRNSSATHELVFLAFQLPPLGSKSYYIEVNNKSKTTEVKKQNYENLLILKKQVWFQLKHSS